MPELSLPAGFTAIKDVATAKAGERLSCIGILVSFKVPYKSKGDDWVLEFNIQDHFPNASVGGRFSVRCKIFRREPSWLPSVGSVGDPVLIRDIRTKWLYDKMELVSSNHHNTGVLFFPADKIPTPEFSTAYGHGGLSTLPFSSTLDHPTPPNWEEQLAIINIKAAAAPFVNQIKKHSTQKGSEPSYNNKRALIEAMTFNKYYDILGEVVKIFSVNFGALDLYITDYTVNADLFLYEDPRFAEDQAFTSTKWQGPFGQVTMAVRLWEPHASFVREMIQEGDIVMLKNVHTKMSQANKLEGALHQDQAYPEKVLVSKVKYPRQLEEIEKRKREYLDKHESEQAKIRVAQIYAAAAGAKKPSAKASAKRREEKKEKERQKKEQEQKQLEKEAEEKAAARAGLNPHVRASHPSISLSTVDEIIHNPARKIKSTKGEDLELPFVNAKYRVRLRVVDFCPGSLQSFTRSMADDQWNTDLSDPSLKDRRRDDRWVWGFCLLVEAADAPVGSAPERFPLFVTEDSGQYLLKMNATDLSDAADSAVKKLEEKLFLLWGNLLELRRELIPQGVKFPLATGDPRLKNMPFECCIVEYGVPVPKSPRWPYGYQRMHKIMGTTIMD